MRIKKFKDLTETQINNEISLLESNGHEIIDVVHYPQTANHYVEYWLIKYKEK